MHEEQQLDLDNKEWQDALQIINYHKLYPSLAFPNRKGGHR